MGTQTTTSELVFMKNKQVKWYKQRLLQEPQQKQKQKQQQKQQRQNNNNNNKNNSTLPEQDPIPQYRTT